MKTKHKRAFRYRFSPTVEQQRILARTFGCVRFVYNHFLHLRKQSHFQEQSAEYTRSAFTWDGTHLTLAKMEESLAIRWSRPLPTGCKPTTVTVTKDAANRYFVSFLVEEEIAPLPVVNKTVGLDLGLTSMVVLSTGESVGNPRYFARDEKKLAKAQRRLARKKKGSRNRAKARQTVARIHARIADRRRDYQHRLSTRIVRENQVMCVEIDRWYPSSKTCSACQHVLETLSLEERFWTCPACGTFHDRDRNAARNVLAAGLAAAACGEQVRPGRAKAPAGTAR